MRNHIDLTVDFGRGGNARAYQLDGWSGPEPGFTWTIGESSALRLPRVAAPYGGMLEMRCTPFTVPPALDGQRLIVRIDGTEVGNLKLRLGRSLAFPLPTSASGQGDMLVTIGHPDCVRPRDVSESPEARRIAFMFSSIRLLIFDEPVPVPAVFTSAIRLVDGLGREEALMAEAGALAGMPVNELVRSFEALAGNCEFGFFQRRCGAEPLSLLRFAAGRYSLVLRGIDNGFEGIDRPDHLLLRLDPTGSEWMVEETTYGLVYHTFVSPNAVTREGMYPREAKRLAFLARKFMEDVVDGTKIFVCKDEFGMSLAEVLPLALALNRHGPCTILWLTATTAPDQHGRVDVIAPRVMRGYLDGLAEVGDPGAFSLAGWLSVCVNALLLFKGNSQGRT